MQENIKIVAGIDIGTSDVKCVIGQTASGSETVNIVGVGKCKNQGYRKGVVVDVMQSAKAIDTAVGDAERMAGQQINRAATNINGGHITGLNTRGVIAVSGRNINEDDIDRVSDAATVVQLPSNREIIHLFARNYRLDSQDNIKDPLGMTGTRLEVDAHVVTASTPAIRNLQQLLETAKIPTSQVMVSGIASAKAVLTRDLSENGILLLDIGAVTTNAVVYEDGEVQHVAVIPVGGTSITNDLAIGLKCDLSIAESLKLAYDKLSNQSSHKQNNFSFKSGKEHYSYKTKEIDMIITARLEELFESVDKELKKIGKSGRLPGGVILTGGTSQLKGINDIAQGILKLYTRRVAHLPLDGLKDQVNSPIWDGAIGLMLADLQASEHQNNTALTGAFNVGGVKKVFNNLLNKFK